MNTSWYKYNTPYIYIYKMRENKNKLFSIKKCPSTTYVLCSWWNAEMQKKRRESKLPQYYAWNINEYIE